MARRLVVAPLGLEGRMVRWHHRWAEGLYERGDLLRDLGRRVLESEPGLVVTVHFDDGARWDEDAPYDEVDFILPASDVSPQLIDQIRELSVENWWAIPKISLKSLNSRN